MLKTFDDRHFNQRILYQSTGASANQDRCWTNSCPQFNSCCDARQSERHRCVRQRFEGARLFQNLQRLIHSKFVQRESGLISTWNLMYLICRRSRQLNSRYAAANARTSWWISQWTLAWRAIRFLVNAKLRWHLVVWGLEVPASLAVSSSTSVVRLTPTTSWQTAASASTIRCDLSFPSDLMTMRHRHAFTCLHLFRIIYWELKWVIVAQMLKLQELSEHIPHGEMPRHLTVYMDRNLCERLVPGNRATITGNYVFCCLFSSW